MVDTAKIFWSGRSQAVRLPKMFRFEGQEVRIGREGRRVYLEPVGDSYTMEDVAEDAARRLDHLRLLIQEGLETGGDEPLDMGSIKRDAREGR